MIWWLVGCWTSTATISSEDVFETWSRDPKASVEQLMAIGDPITRMGVLETLLLDHPEITTDFCPRLPPGPERVRCSRVVQRPHLWTPRQPARPTKRPASGPSRTYILPEQFPDPFQDVSPRPPKICDEGPDPFGCQLHKASEAAKRKEGELAAAICRVREDGKWRQECFFHAAEHRLRLDNPEGYGAAVDLCAGSGSFGSDCLLHLHGIFKLNVTPTATSGPERWEQATADIDQALKRWADQPAFAAWVRDLLWSHVLRRVYLRSEQVVGNPLDHLPADLAPHVRAAAAFRLMRDTDPEQPLSLAAWQVKLTETLARRAPRGEAWVKTGKVDHVDMWERDGPGDETIPAVFFLGFSRRATDPDPEIDGLIALLEAAARQEVVLKGVLADGRSHPEPIVRWTANRLSEEGGARP